jgi:hypothetical protein
MSRLQVPLVGKLLWATGDVLLRGELDLLLRDNNGILKPALFRVDSATDMTTFPAADAKNLDLPLPRSPVLNLQHSQTGLEIRNGFLRARIVGMDATEYAFPCFFLGDPDTVVQPKPSATSARNLLGLTGVVDKLRLSFDGTPAAGAQFGYLIVEKL